MTATGPVPGRIGQHVAEAFVRAKEAMRPHDRHHADERLTSWLDAFEGDMRDRIAPLLADHAANPDVPDEVRHLLRVGTDPEHATEATLLIALVGALAYPLISALMSGTVMKLEGDIMKAQTPAWLTPDQLALAVVRHTEGDNDVYGMAARSGLRPGLFDVLVKNTGDSPAVGDLLLLYRRRQIDEARLTLGLRQSRLRDEWAPEILKLRYAPPSVGESLAGAVQGHLTPAEGQAKAEDAGLDPKEWGWLLETAGRPPGTEMLLALMNRKLITEGFVRAAIRESDIKNKYTDAIIQSAVYIPPVRSILPMLRAGAISDARATELLKDHGVRDVDVPAYLAEGHHVRSSSAKTASASLVTRAYEAHLLDRGAAHGRIVALGYSSADADLMLNLADDSRTERYVQAVITRAHALYVAHKLDATGAHNMLASDGVPGAAITELLRLWTLERDANVAHLTVAQLQGALRRNVIDNAEFRTRCHGLGYTDADAIILAAEAFPPPKAKAAASTRDLSVAQLTKLYKAAQMSRAQLVAAFVGLGYDANEAEQLATLADQ